jgi:hypothetical protein
LEAGAITHLFSFRQFLLAISKSIPNYFIFSLISQKWASANPADAKSVANIDVAGES